jgi:DNA uptake protein ComE-like DNA-binding protein
MNRMKTAVPMVALLLLWGAPLGAQVGKSQGVVDVNAAGEKDLLSFPHMTPEVVRALLAARPFAGITELNAFLLGQKLTQEQANELYGKAFVHLDLNRATREEILLVPGAGRKMAREFAEYRPWKTWAQFDKEIGKYVGPKETARLAQYCFIPIGVNQAKDEDLKSIPGLDDRALAALKEGRPWKSAEELEAGLAKKVDPKEAKRVARFLRVAD